MERKLTREVKIGSLKMGGTNPIIIQSMCNTDTRDVEATVAQILALEKEGCELVRVAIPDMAAADAVGEIKKRIHIPLVADIHFDYRLALRVMELGIDKVRINPGNIGDEARIKQVVDMAKEKQIPIRIGVNSGSLEKELVEKYDGVTPQGLVESAMKHVHILEKFGFMISWFPLRHRMCRSPSKRIDCFPKQSRIPFTSALQKPARPMQARLNLLSASGRFLPWVSGTRFVFP